MLPRAHTPRRGGALGGQPGNLRPRCGTRVGSALHTTPRLRDLLRRMNLPPQGRPRPLAPPFLTCPSDAIPFRTCAVAESTGIHDHKGEQPFGPPLRDCDCETPFHAQIGWPPTPSALAVGIRPVIDLAALPLDPRRAILCCHLAPITRPEIMPRPPRCLPGNCQLAKTHLECGAGRRCSLVPNLRLAVVR